eukprot:ANDGO_00662.mRNA.1 Protein pianissimo A
MATSVHEEHLEVLLEELQRPNASDDAKVGMLPKLVELYRELGSQAFYAKLPQQDLIRLIRKGLCDFNRFVRIASLKTIRGFAVTPEFLVECWRHQCQFFVCRSAERDKKLSKERLQALKFIAHAVWLHGKSLPRICVHTLVSIVEFIDDGMRRRAAEILRDLLIVNPRAVARANGIRTLVQISIDPLFADMSVSVIRALAYVLDAESHRLFIRPYLDLKLLFLPFTDLELSLDDDDGKRRFALAIRAICMLFRTWAGTIALCAELRSVVYVLRQNGSVIRKQAIVDMLYEILRSIAPNKVSNFLNPEEYADALGSAADWISLFNSTSYSSSSTPMSPKGGGAGHERVASSAAALTASSSSKHASFPVASPQNRSRRQSTIVGKSVLRDGKQDQKQAWSRWAAASEAYRVDLVDIFLSFVLSGYYHTGVVDALMRESPMSEKSSRLLILVLALSETTLSAKRCLQLHDSWDTYLQSRGVEALHGSIMHQVNIDRARKSILARHIDEYRISKETALIDTVAMMKDTGVNLFKDFQKWNFSLIYTLLEGPFSNPDKMKDAMEKSKFVKRITSFFKPDKHLFVDEPYLSNLEEKYTRVGRILIRRLCSTDRFIKFLAASGLVNQIVKYLRDELNSSTAPPPSGAFSGPPTPSSSAGRNGVQFEFRPFASQVVGIKMSRDFFALLGELSSHPRGILLLVELDAFPVLYRLVDSKLNRDDLAQLVMKHFDYSLVDETYNQYARNLLTTAAMSGSNKIRFVAAMHLRTMLNNKMPNFSEWGIGLLKAMLEDPWEEIVRTARAILEDAMMASDSHLDALIMHPPRTALMDVPGCSLLLRFLARSDGLAIAMADGWLQRQMDTWLATECDVYVDVVERSLEEAFELRGDSSLLSSLSKKGRSVFKHTESSIVLPLHFFGELCRTEEGCAFLLNASGVLDRMIESALTQCPKQTAALWATGWIGASEYGLSLLLAKEPHFLRHVSDMAFNHPSLSVRGTCCYIISLFSVSPGGRALVERLGWECSLKVALPRDLTNFFTVERKPSFQGSATHVSELYSKEPVLDVANREDALDVENDGDVEAFSKCSVDPNIYVEIIRHICGLSNPVIQEVSSKAIRKLRTENSDLFLDPILAAHAMVLMERFRFRLNARRFIHEMFELALFDDEGLSLLDAYVSVHAHSDKSSAASLVSMNILGSSMGGRTTSSGSFPSSTSTDNIDSASATQAVVSPRLSITVDFVEASNSDALPLVASTVDNRGARRGARHARQMSEDVPILPTPPQHDPAPLFN